MDSVTIPGGHNPRCQATSKRSGEQCRNRAVNGAEVCRMHGGTQPKGVASAHWKDGRYSKHMPGVYEEEYETLLSDPERLQQTEEIALARSRVMHLLARVDSGESASLVRDLRRAWRSMQRAQRGGDSEEAGRQLQLLGELINARHSDYAAWEDVDRWLGRQKNLVESERRRIIENQEMISLEHHMALVSAMVAAVKRHVADPRVLTKISQEFGALARNGKMDQEGLNPN